MSGPAALDPGLFRVGVWGSGFRVKIQGLRLRVYRVQGLGFRVYRVQGFRSTFFLS